MDITVGKRYLYYTHCIYTDRYMYLVFDFPFIILYIIYWLVCLLLIMSEFDQTIDPKVVMDHCDLISWYSEFALYLHNQWEYEHTMYFFHIMIDYEQTFDP